MEMTNTENKDNRNRGILVEYSKDELSILEEVAELFDKTYHYGNDLFTIKDVLEHYKKVNHYLSARDMLIIGTAMYQIQKDISDGFIKSEFAIKEETNQAWEQYYRGEFNEDILTYIPDDVETGYNPIEEKPRGIKKIQLETMPVVEDINLEEGEYVSNSELGGFVNKVNNKLEKGRARRRKGEKAAGNFRPNC